MIVAQNVQGILSRTIPDSAPAMFAGQAIARTNLQASGTAGVLGILQTDLPAKVVGPQTYNLVFNSPRTVAVATTGRLAIRVASQAAFAALSAGGSFGVLNGDATTVALAGGTAAATLQGDLLVIDEKIPGADGFGYIMVIM